MTWNQLKSLVESNLTPGQLDSIQIMYITPEVTDSVCLVFDDNFGLHVVSAPKGNEYVKVDACMEYMKIRLVEKLTGEKSNG